MKIVYQSSRCRDCLLRNSSHRAFTLVEILIVIAVLVLLAGLLFPVFSRAREGARRVSCASNLHQIGLAFLQYSQDNNNRFPQGKNPPPSGKGNGWAGSIYAYVKNQTVFRCPSDNGLDGILGTASYAYNQALPMKLSASAPSYTFLPRIRNAHKTVLLCEVTTSRVFDLADTNENQSPHASGLTGTGRLWPQTAYATGYLGGMTGVLTVDKFISLAGRHNGLANYLFCDGHLKALNGNQISPGMAADNPTAEQVEDETMGQAAGTENAKFSGTFSPI